MPPKKTKDSDLCASGITDPLERKVMAKAMKLGEDQIDLIRQSKEQESEQEPQTEEPNEEK